jgi:hypothetical protein
MAQRWRAILLCLLLASALTARAWAADGKVVAVDPPSAGQGETVLLTITGEALPQGTLVIEFYPQQIALLDILAASDKEIQALVKIARTAPPGKYNVMVYNQRDEEAFGNELLTVAASVVTPVFKNYDPKTIADAATGFALLLTGEYIAAPSIEHLTMEWQQNGEKVSGLATTFALSGGRAVACVVEGQPPPGVLRGRVFLDGVPIYLVEVTVAGGSALIVGHTPAALDANANPLKVRLLGSELTPLAVQGLGVELASAAISAKAQQLIWLDAASCQAEFSGPLPAGDYTLTVVSAGSMAYSSPVKLVANATPPPVSSATPDTTTPESSAPTSETAAPEEAGPPSVPAPPVEAPAQPQPETAAPEAEQTPVQPAKPSLRIERVEPAVIDPAGKACRFTVYTSGIEESLLHELTPVLTVGGQAATLLLAGSSESVMTCVFGPPPDGWPSGAAGELALELAGAATTSATFPVTVGAAAPAPQTASTPAPASIATTPETPGAAWQAQSANITTGPQGQVLVAGITPPQAGDDLALLEGSFTLLPDELGYASAFDNLALNGQLAFKTNADGTLAGECAGNFISGSLMITLKYNNGTPHLSMLTLEAPRPKLKITAPSAAQAVHRADGTWQPATLQWTVDCAPLVYADAQFLKLYGPGGQDAAAVVTASGSQAVVECPVDELVADGKVQAELKLGVPCDAAGALTLTLPVQEQAPAVPAEAQAVALGEPAPVVSASAPPETGSTQPETGSPAPETGSTAEVKAIEMVEPVLHACSDGLWFVIRAPEQGPALAAWRELAVETDNPLLQPNLGRFKPEVVPVDSESQGQLVRILLRRDKQVLPDSAYGLLLGQLLEAGRCQLTVRWAALGYTLSGGVEIDEQEWSGASLLKELGVGEEPPV